MRILILGGDGYLGWPTSMHFARKGHEVHAVDDYLRRRAHEEAGTDSLTPIGVSLPARAEAFLAQSLGGRVEPLKGDRYPGSSAVVKVVGSAGTVIAAGSKYRHASSGGAATVNQSAG